MMKKIENLLKTSYARITTSEEPNEKKWVFSSVHNRAFNYNSSALFEYVKNEAKHLGCYEVTLNVWSGNTSAEKFYEKMGLKTKECQMEYIL